jgi:hypothetical protein
LLDYFDYRWNGEAKTKPEEKEEKLIFKQPKT